MGRISTVAAFVAALAVGTAPERALAHPGHPTATPSGALAGASPAGLGIVLAGVLLLSGVLLLAHEDVLADSVRGVAVAVGAALTVIGAVVAFVDL